MSEAPKKILIVSSYCYEQATANGLCALALFDCLSAESDTYLLGIGDIGKAVVPKKYRINPGDFSEIDQVKGHIRFLSRTAKALFIPDINKKKQAAYYRKIAELDSIYGFDIIIAMFFPPETVSAVSLYKKKNGTFKYVIYELDSYTDGISCRNPNFIGDIIKSAKIRWTKKQYRLADKIITMNSHKSNSQSLYSSSFGKKISFADLPLLVDNTGKSKHEDKSKIRFLYTGELDKSYRSPEFLLEILNKKCKNVDWQFDFFSKGNCEDMLNSASSKDSRIIRHGYVDKSTLDSYYNNADILISIGNSCSNSMPSKIINYVSTGLPIIHFSLQCTDVAAEYLAHYPLALIIPWKASVDNAAEMIEGFVNSDSSQQLAFDKISAAYPESSPEFSANIILS